MLKEARRTALPEGVAAVHELIGAALKAANRDYTSIKLRERGTNRVHVFEGRREKVPAPANRPAWLPAQVWKAIVKKKGVERI